MNPRISVIMPVYLGEYDGAAINRKEKFVRAVNSFLSNRYENKELIIISDGCKQSVDVVRGEFGKHLRSGTIKLLELERHEPFTGSVRQKGIDIATGDILCNLDSDDSFTNYHLHNISVTFNPNTTDWAYFNLIRKLDVLNGHEEVVPATCDLDGLCTGNVIWRRGLNVTWNGCDGRQDNKQFNVQLLMGYDRIKHLYGLGYIVHHAVIKKV